MNITESSKKLLNDSNVYEAANGEYHESRLINRRYIVENKTAHKLIPKRNGLKVVIDKDADDLDKVFKAKGRTIPPDEVLDMMKPGKLNIPFADPEGAKGEKLLPPSELLKCIHYFVARKYTKDMKRQSDVHKYLECMDETALLSMGMMLESWVDELVTEGFCKMLLQRGDVGDDKSSGNEEDDDSSAESVIESD
ncbi:hypothetical protein KGF57_002360 [Candida theae]|uniref:Uncharacterized protein n=1 Tax=Candida theae TaxID=1198502 RepID=A0AAD5FYY0_9ASCO|nr:uncharacterized protein KGF57_002360 [Candida theae]KAI5958926.1 hypothetical protein KGF57_002360 [Candida theae]